MPLKNWAKWEILIFEAEIKFKGRVGKEKEGVYIKD